MDRLRRSGEADPPGSAAVARGASGNEETNINAVRAGSARVIALPQ
jgi:hypothetical protein